MRVQQIRCRVAAIFLLAQLAVAVVSGCSRPASTPAESPPPLVFFEYPVQDEVTDFEEFTGRADALQSVELRSRVTGYLKALHFTDGEVVKEGRLLFTIDDRLFKAELDRAEANVKLAQAHLARVDRDFVRVEKLKNSGALSGEEFDKVAGDKAEAEAARNVAAAARVTAQLNLDYTKITAPIDGRMSRRYADPGSLIKADDTALSMLLKVDKIHVYFDVDDRTYLSIRRAIGDGRMSFDGDGKTGVEIGLPDEEGYKLKGFVDFIDNKLDPGTGTLRLRAEVENTSKLLSPGLFVRVKLPISQKQKVMLVPEVSLGTNQGQKFVYALNADGVVVERRVRKVGKQYGRYRVLLDADVQPAERILVKGIQRVREGSKTDARPEPAVPSKSLAPATNQGGPTGVPSKPTGSGTPTSPAAVDPAGPTRAGS